jgi:hypothetical protein
MPLASARFSQAYMNDGALLLSMCLFKSFDEEDSERHPIGVYL